MKVIMLLLLAIGVIYIFLLSQVKVQEFNGNLMNVKYTYQDATAAAEK